MNVFRAAMDKGDAAAAGAAPDTDERRRRKSDTSLADVAIPRAERRTANQRREDRFRNIVDRATLVFRRKTLLVRVVNVSEGGLMIEAPIAPRIGEDVRITFEGHAPLTATVRWVRDGRIGLDVGEGAITLG